MVSPGTLSAALGVARLKSHLEALGRYAGVQVLLAVAMALLVALAAGFGVTALTIWLADRFGAAAAFATVAAGFLVLALLVQIVLNVRRRRHQRRRGAREPLFSDKERSDQAAFGSIAAFAVIGYLLGRRAERH